MGPPYVHAADEARFVCHEHNYDVCASCAARQHAETQRRRDAERVAAEKAAADAAAARVAAAQKAAAEKAQALEISELRKQLALAQAAERDLCAALSSSQRQPDATKSVERALGQLALCDADARPQPQPATAADDPRDKDKDCIVCAEKQRSMALVPCGHVCLCADCAGPLRECPICRQAIRERIKLFYS